MTDPSAWAGERKEIMRRLREARHFPTNTCPASRHAQMIGEALICGKRYPMIEEEPEHVGASLLWTVLALYEARTALKAVERDA